MTDEQKKELWQLFLAIERAQGHVVEFCGIAVPESGASRDDLTKAVDELDAASESFSAWLTKNGCAPK